MSDAPGRSGCRARGDRTVSDWPPPPERDPNVFEKPRPAPRLTGQFWTGVLVGVFGMWTASLIDSLLNLS